IEVGFGYDRPRQGAGVKRFARVPVRSQLPEWSFLRLPEDRYYAVGEIGRGTAPGDSGGPSYVDSSEPTVAGIHSCGITVFDNASEMFGFNVDLLGVGSDGKSYTAWISEKTGISIGPTAPKYKVAALLPAVI